LSLFYFVHFIFWFSNINFYNQLVQLHLQILNGIGFTQHLVREGRNQKPKKF